MAKEHKNFSEWEMINQTIHETRWESWASQDRFAWTLLAGTPENTEAKQPYYTKDTLQDSWKIIQYVNTIHYCTEATSEVTGPEVKWKVKR